MENDGFPVDSNEEYDTLYSTLRQIRKSLHCMRMVHLQEQPKIRVQKYQTYRLMVNPVKKVLQLQQSQTRPHQCQN